MTRLAESKNISTLFDVDYRREVTTVVPAVEEVGVRTEKVLAFLDTWWSVIKEDGIIKT